MEMWINVVDISQTFSFYNLNWHIFFSFDVTEPRKK